MVAGKTSFSTFITDLSAGIQTANAQIWQPTTYGKLVTNTERSYQVVPVLDLETRFKHFKIMAWISIIQVVGLTFIATIRIRFDDMGAAVVARLTPIRGCGFKSHLLHFSFPAFITRESFFTNSHKEMSNGKTQNPGNKPG